jgi:DNA-binding XRE family transcriptional regulator
MRHMARTSGLDQNPDIIEQFAAAYAEHDSSREKLAATFGISKDTVTRWVKDERVQAAVTRIREARVNRLQTKVDAKLIRLLEQGKLDDDPELLLKLRREIVPREATVNVKNDVDSATLELYRRVLGDPDLAAALGAPAIDGTVEGDESAHALELPEVIEE